MSTREFFTPERDREGKWFCCKRIGNTSEVAFSHSGGSVDPSSRFMTYKGCAKACKLMNMAYAAAIREQCNSMKRLLNG